MNKRPDLERTGKIIEAVRPLAAAYYAETGKPLGATSEIAEYDAARILNLRLCGPRNEGFDAVRIDGEPKRIQIKGRMLSELRGRLGAIKLNKPWDSVLLVLLDEDYQPEEIYEAERSAVELALRAPGSKSRNEKGQLGVRQFVRVARLIWRRKPGDVLNSPA